MASRKLAPATKLVRHSASCAAPSAGSLSTRHPSTRYASTQPSTASKSDGSPPAGYASDAASRHTINEQTAKEEPRKSQAELDKDLQAKMAGISGDGGGAGVAYEDGQPVAMKRAVKNNMFRLI